MRSLFAALIGIALLTACGGSEQHRDVGAPAEFAAAWHDLAAIGNRPTVRLDAGDRPEPPKGFTAADMDVLASDAVSVLRRSISPQVELKAPDDAIPMSRPI